MLWVASAQARLVAWVLLPVPPFWLTIATTGGCESRVVWIDAPVCMGASAQAWYRDDGTDATGSGGWIHGFFVRRLGRCTRVVGPGVIPRCVRDGHTPRRSSGEG